MIAGLDRDHVERQVAIGMAHARAGHWDLAVLTLGGALERNPNEPEIYRALGQVWLEFGKPCLHFGVRSMYLPPCGEKWTDEPGPDGALMVGRVAAQRIADVSSAISRILGVESPQTPRSQ